MNIPRNFRFIPLILAGILIAVSFAGCGSNSENKQNQAVTAQGSTSGQTKEPVEYTASPEIKNAKLYANVLQIGNTVFTKPLQYSEIIKAGAVFGAQDITEDYLINPGESKPAELQIGATTIRLTMVNDTDQPCALKDARIKNTLYANGPQMFFPMGVRVGDAISDLTEKWGQPSVDLSKSSDKVLTYQYLEYPIALSRVHTDSMGDGARVISATGFDYTVTIDRDTSRIASISSDWLDRSLAGTVQEVTKAEKYMNGDTYLLSYKIPYEFKQNTITNGGKALTVYLVDNVPYVFVLDANLQGLGRPNGEISEKTLTEALNPQYASTKYEVDKVTVDGAQGRIIGYLQTDQGYQCVGVYMNKDKQYTTRESLLIPLAEKGEVSAAALAKFKTIMTSFMDSISLSDKQ